jgi:4-amino-4-deoxy-L-arabinose transferase-like glycosyltransferase
MFDLIDEEPRGFSGRPLAALLFAVGTGCLAYSVGSWMQSDLAGWVSLAVMMLIPVYFRYRGHQAAE